MLYKDKRYLWGYDAKTGWVIVAGRFVSAASAREYLALYTRPDMAHKYETYKLAVKKPLTNEPNRV